MNIVSKLNQYFENKLSESEKIEFEKELAEHVVLKKLYQEYFQINQTMEKELYSSLLQKDNDPLLSDLTLSQKLDIESDILRFYKNESVIKNPTSNISDNENISSATINPHSETNNRIDSDEKKFIDIIKKATIKKSPPKSRYFFHFAGIAATIALSFFSLKLIVDQVVIDNHKMEPNEAFAEFYKPLYDKELKAIFFGEQKMYDDYVKLRESKFTNPEEYERQLKIINSNYEFSLFYLGIISLERNDFQDAKSYFSKILSLKNPERLYSANFYLALSCLAEGNLSESRSLLNELSKSSNPYRKKSKTILRMLKK